MKNIIIFGAPGSGKGTHAAVLKENFNLKHVSTGDLLRAEIKHGTELGLKAKDIISQGKLVSDSIVIGMITNFVKENKDCNGFIFDGFPRTIAQAEELDKIMATINSKIHGVIFLDVEKAELIKRILFRGKESGRADDQDESIIENRVSVYNKDTSPVKEYYSKKNIVKSVHAQGSSIEEIYKRVEVVYKSI